MALTSVQRSSFLAGFAFGLFLLANDAIANQPPATEGANLETVGQIEIVDRGIYRVERSSSQNEYSPETGVDQWSAGRPILLESTTTIPAQLGKEFGFEFKPSGIQFQALDLTLVTEFPSQGLYDHETQTTMYRDERSLESIAGQSQYQGYNLDAPSELVPGIWTFKIMHHGQVLAAQSFTLVIP